MSPIRGDAVYCDGLGCRQSHPLDHEALGEESFGTGRWLGWIYLDLNRPDLFPHVLRFCDVRCCQWWLDKQSVHGGVREFSRQLTPLDEALRRPHDEVARTRAGLGTA